MPDSLAEQARDFFEQAEVRALTGPSRLGDVLAGIASTGGYTHTPPELELGARLAFRNHARCVGRSVWRSLMVRDRRSCSTPETVAAECAEHLRVATNGGGLRAVITVFEPAPVGGEGLTIWNPQLIRYAGHRQPDGAVVGDPQHVELTDTVRRLGWHGAGGPFDILPLLISEPGGPPRMFVLPEDAVLEVPLRHPEFPWFADLGLRWHANPAVSNMTLVIGGIHYPAAPFSGWYVSSEIGARDLSDTYRYDVLPTVGGLMGLDMSSNRTLWQDRALVELNRAVLFSFREEGVHIVDHHTVASQFMGHVEREHANGRPVPTDWTWVNPPLSASLTPTFHRGFDPPDAEVRPNFVPRAGAPLPSCPIHVERNLTASV